MTDPVHEPEKRLKESEARLRAILETAVEGIITIDARGRVESMNPAAEKIFGYSAAEVVGRNVNLLMPSPHREHHDEYIANYLRSGHARIIGIGREVLGRRKDGSTFPMDLSVSEVRLEDRRLFTGFIRDITERKRLQAAIPAAAEQEKARIARDLHDGLGQQLGGTLFLARGLERDLRETASPLTDRASQIARLLDEALSQARQLSRGLHPLPAESDGLMLGLESLAERVARDRGIDCRFECETAVLIEDPEVATHLYRLGQEALENALKHSQATRIDLVLTFSGDRLTLAIRDNGKGLPEDLPRRGLGLQSMRLRASLVGGDFRLQSQPGQGTEVLCSLPRPVLPRTPNASCP